MTIAIVKGLQEETVVVFVAGSGDQQQRPIFAYVSTNS
jgi:hypothetical protein